MKKGTSLFQLVKQDGHGYRINWTNQFWKILSLWPCSRGGSHYLFIIYWMTEKKQSNIFTVAKYFSSRKLQKYEEWMMCLCDHDVWRSIVLITKSFRRCCLQSFNMFSQDVDCCDLPWGDGEIPFLSLSSWKLSRRPKASAVPSSASTLRRRPSKREL